MIRPCSKTQGQAGKILLSTPWVWRVNLRGFLSLLMKFSKWSSYSEETMNMGQNNDTELTTSSTVSMAINYWTMMARLLLNKNTFISVSFHSDTRFQLILTCSSAAVKSLQTQLIKCNAQSTLLYAGAVIQMCLCKWIWPSDEWWLLTSCLSHPVLPLRLTSCHFVRMLWMRMWN